MNRPLGVKAATSWLNERGHRTRRGARWGIGQLHKLLTSPTYKGDYSFNRKVWKTKEDKPETEQVAVAVDPIIEPSLFDAVQARLKARNPKTTPPRVVTGPILLTGIATCASCGGGMTLRTGKSGRYRYYTCATCAQQGKSACKGRSIPMDRLDTLVTERLAEMLFEPPRVYRRVVCSMTRRPYRVCSGLHRTPPLLLRAGCSREGRANGGCYTSRPISGFPIRPRALISTGRSG